jgi:hypothetical protein
MESLGGKGMKKLQIKFLIIFCIFFLIGASVKPIKVGGLPPGSGYQGKDQLSSAVSLRLDREFGKMPLYFIANQGQTDRRVAFYIQGKDKTIYFTSEGLTIALTKSRKLELSNLKRKLKDKGSRGERNGRESLLSLGLGQNEDEGNGSYERWVVKLDFVGTNPGVTPVGLEETGTVISYFKGKPEEWKTGIPTYSKIIYRDLWPGIDLVYFGTVNKLKYEFIVHPGADPGKIKLSYRGATEVKVNDEGRLEVITPIGVFEDDVPVAWQEIEGKRRTIPLSYRLEKRGIYYDRWDGLGVLTEEYEPCVYSFEVGEYDKTHDLVLDPAILIYCGYIGGSGKDYGMSIAVDSYGNAYVTGYTSSSEATFPVRVGPDLTFNGGESPAFYYDAFVAKVNSSGTALVYCGYIGGSDEDRGMGIAVDAYGNAYVTGFTDSSEVTFPVIVGPDLTYNGYYFHDAFVAKVNPFGTGLVYCGYIGGSSTDKGLDIAVDRFGNAYVTGYTCSPQYWGFPVIIGPDLTQNGLEDAFVAKVNSSGTELVYCGYIGGDMYTYGYSISVDSFGNAYVTGETDCNEFTFPVTVGPDLTYNGGYRDAFVAKVNASGTTLVYCGYIGGSGTEISCGIEVDSSGNAYVIGYTYTNEETFPVAVGPDLTHNGGYSDVFISKIHYSEEALGINVISPNGGEFWPRGSTQSIIWSSFGLEGDVTIDLHKGGIFYSRIGSAQAASGKFSWAIPSDFPLGNDYKVRIYQGSIGDYSDNDFSIVESQIITSVSLSEINPSLSPQGEMIESRATTYRYYWIRDQNNNLVAPTSASIELISPYFPSEAFSAAIIANGILQIGIDFSKNTAPANPSNPLTFAFPDKMDIGANLNVPIRSKPAPFTLYEIPDSFSREFTLFAGGSAGADLG